MITIDGSYGEGGGQILRTSLTLAAVTGKPLKMVNIRAGRKNPGLAAQHLTAVLAVAAICDARLEGAHLGSQTLTFEPRSPPQAGSYSWDVAAARKGGSAGSTSLILQTVLLPLALAEGRSKVTVKGGTHVPWSPPYHFLEKVYLPTLARLGVEARADIERWGWYPIGRGCVKAQIKEADSSLKPIDLNERGEFLRLSGLSALSNLPKHIAQRQRDRALEVLRREDFEADVRIEEGKSLGRGTMVFLWAGFENTVAGFTALGAPGKPAEKVAEEACQAFLEYYRSGAVVDKHLADQLILPLALADGHSSFTTCQITQHLLTNIWVVKRFIDIDYQVEGSEGEKGRVSCGR
ncbi:MAG: RNA 3'-terminal phosphate cyclase [Anaerolineae bacterium]